MKPHRIINAVVPIRICDVGGWTDTHFAGHGAVLNIAVYPHVEVQCHIWEDAGSQARVTLSMENYGERYTIDPENPAVNKHPIIEAALQSMEIPEDWSILINVFSYAPPGGSLGTSAAVSVAIIGVLDALTPGRLTPHEVARLAHRIETEKLKLECGVQDQLASAYGGINFIEINDYPDSTVTELNLPDNHWWELEHRLLLVVTGGGHHSSDLHRKVIDNLGPDSRNDLRLERLRDLARQAREALTHGDFRHLGSLLSESTEVQRELYSGLISPSFDEIMNLSKDLQALGWKVNGAGGEGGSMTILTDGEMAKKRRLERILTDKGYQCLPIRLSTQGMRVWEGTL